MKESQNKAITAGQILYPVILLCVTFLLLMAFQMSQILRDRDSLVSMKNQQEKGVEDSQRVQAQLVALIVGTQKLASEGNKNAEKIVDKLKTIGVIPQPQPQALPPEAGGMQSHPGIGGPAGPLSQPQRPLSAEPVSPAPVPVQLPPPGPVKP